MKERNDIPKRTVLCLLMCCVSLLSWGQDSSPFTVDRGLIIWQRVYQSQLDSAGVATALEACGQVTDIIGVPGGVACQIKPRKADFRSAGFNSSNVANIMLSNKMTGHATILVREGRYKVTVDNMVFSRNNRYGAELTAPIEALDMINKKNELRQIFLRNTGVVIDYEWTRLFELDAYTKSEDDW